MDALIGVAAAFLPVVIYLMRSPHKADTQEVLMLFLGWLLVMMVLASIANWFFQGPIGYFLFGAVWLGASYYAWTKSGRERSGRPKGN
jgi:FtsH-binding integral membrane protein